MGYFMGGEGTVKIDWSRYNSILCKLGFDGSFRELICSHGFEPTFECESLVGLYLPYEKHPYATEDLLSDLKPYVEPGSWFRWEYEDGMVEIEDFGKPELLARALADNGEVEVANVDPRFVHATLVASKSLGVGIAQPLDESGEVSDPLVFINLIDFGVSWKGTDRFYRYVDDGTSNGIEGEWSEVPEEWRGEDDPDYTEEFRELAEMELDGKERHMVLSALVKKG